MDTKQTQHTPGLWVLTDPRVVKMKSGNEIEYTITNAQGSRVVSLRFRADAPTQAESKARFIVRACNSHEALLAALKEAEIEMDRMRWGDCDFATLAGRLKVVQDAIAAAEGD